MAAIAQEKTQPQYNPLKLAACSSLGYWIADMIMYPLDTISTKIKAHTAEFLSFKQGYKQVIKGEGFKGVFRGFSTTFPCSFVPSLLYFSSYETMNKYGMSLIKKVQNENISTALKICMPLLTSSLAEIVCLIPYMPFDVVRTRLQVNDTNFQYTSVLQGLKDVQQKEGFLRLYKASHIYIATTTMQTGLLFWFYEMQRFFLLHNTQSEDGRHKLTIKQSILVSLSSSLLSTFMVNPFDLILTRYQVIDSSKQKLSVRKITKDLIKNEGYIAFFKGLTPRLLISCANSVLFLPVYEHFKSLYGIDISEN
ncbi:carrier protein (macronuclear) [Tetrahymena thermophila SB210]|uniref:Carrier protein n=1 Tax=Tetrahymena thermophila (strain SB210) TaxID=312017 RepID=Q22CY1_TETTS|nr:carrier protein [Tetrahymena thermophila SB210]EAR83138.1 carrier protein [Tetrahymena thermophila SB210]|eukprot:XP_001030801.1 carrier protein [Tetrahymena thermophila SB210]